MIFLFCIPKQHSCFLYATTKYSLELTQIDDKIDTNCLKTLPLDL